MENKFRAGEVVFERIRPGQRLVIVRSVANVYYCRGEDDKSGKTLVFFERELMPPLINMSQI